MSLSLYVYPFLYIPHVLLRPRRSFVRRTQLYWRQLYLQESNCMITAYSHRNRNLLTKRVCSSLRLIVLQGWFNLVHCPYLRFGTLFLYPPLLPPFTLFQVIHQISYAKGSNANTQHCYHTLVEPRGIGRRVKHDGPPRIYNVVPHAGQKQKTKGGFGKHRISPQGSITKRRKWGGRGFTSDIELTSLMPGQHFFLDHHRRIFR